MSFHLTYLFLLILNVSTESDYSKLDQLLQLQGTNDYVKLTPDLFKKFVQNQSKNYIIITYFTTTVYEDKCPGCSIINPIFRKIAYSYKVSSANEASKSEDEKLKPVIFSILEYSKDSMEILQKFQFRNIPDLYISNRPFTEDSYKYNIDRSRLFEYKEGIEYTTEKMIRFINEKTGRDIMIQVRFMDYVKDYGIYVFSVLIIVLFLWSFYKRCFDPKFWWMLSMVVYAICMGGIVYDILHGSSLGYLDLESEEILAIAQGPRDQFIIEGFVMSAMISLSGFGLLTVNLASNIEGKWVIRLVSLIGIAIWILSGYCVLLVYKKKSGWYSPSFEPPEGYIKGSLLRDQGNSF